MDAYFLQGGLLLEVKINREIRDYSEAVYFGLNLRQFVFSVLACGIAVGLYFLLNNNYTSVIPYDMEQQRKEIREFLDDLTTRDQKMFEVVITVMHTANTLEELNCA